MPIIEGDELLQTREAKEAGVDTADEADADDAVRRAEAKLNLALGYKVVDDDESHTFISTAGDTTITVPNKRVLTLDLVTENYPDQDPADVYPFELRSGFYV